MKILFFSNEHPSKRKLAALIASHYKTGNVEIFQSLSSFDATDHLVQKVLQEREINVNDNQIYNSADITKERYDIIVVLCKCFRAPILSYPGFPAVVHWPLENPVKRGMSPNQIQSNLRGIRDDLIHRIKHLFQDGYLDVFKAQSQNLFDLFNDQTQGVLKFNRDELITGFNEMATDITGYTEPEVLGKPLHYVIPDDMVSRHALAIMDEGVLFRKTKLKLKLSTQELIKVTATFKSIPNSKGQGGIISFEELEEDPVLQPDEGSRGLERLSWDRVEAALKQTAGNRTKASRILGVGRATFYRFLDREKARGRIPKTDLV